MSAKEIKAHLKAARAFIDTKKYEEATEKCQMVFALDANNYQAHVFAGLATLQSGKQQEAKQHYQSAITIAPQEQLAWKGLANLYSKGVGQDDVTDAIATYSKLITFSQGDDDKMIELLQQVAAIASKLSGVCSQAAVDACVLVTKCSQDQQSVIEAWRILVAMLKNCTQLTMEQESLLLNGCEVVLSGSEEQRDVYHTIRINLLERRYMECADLSSVGGVKDQLLRCCEDMRAEYSSHPLPLVVTVRALLAQCCADYPIVVSPDLSVVAQSLKMVDEDNSLIGLVNVLTQVNQLKNLTEAREKAITNCNDDCSSCIVMATLYSKLHDIDNTITLCQKGLKLLHTCPASLHDRIHHCLKVLLGSAYLANEDHQSSLEVFKELSTLHPSNPLVLSNLVKCYILSGDGDAAAKAHQQLANTLNNDDPLVLTTAGLLHQSLKEYDRAIECFQQALEYQPSSAEYHLNLAQCLSQLPAGDKKRSHNLLLKAAKLDPYNTDTLVTIGDYYRRGNNNNSAMRCYQKALQFNPRNFRAAIMLGDCYMLDGNEESGVNLYRKVTNECSVIKAKEAWLRLGLYQNSQSQYTEAIKSFLSCIRGNLHDVHCWECLAEAYFNRGSYRNSLKAFEKALEIDPQSVYCQYRSAFIKEKLGDPMAAIAGYTVVLEMSDSYVLALKGRGSSYLSLARLSLLENFDGRAVDYASRALRDLTRAAQLRPRYVSVWKMIGDVCTCLSPISSVEKFTVPAVVAGKDQVASEVDKLTLLNIGTRAYKRALELEPNSSCLWYDVAIGYLHVAQTDPHNKSDSLRAALNCAKKSVSLEPASTVYWNVLGVTASYPGIEDYSLAQHAFIKSIKCQQDNAVAWTNLGVLYMRMNQIELAYKAFCNAQSADPTYSGAWIGQALVAETMGRIEKMDLFSHSTQLGYTPEGSIGFAYWVCHTLTTLQPKLLLLDSGCGLNDAARKLLLQARDCMQKYTARNASNACAFNYLGLLYETEGLLSLAKEAFKQSLQLLEKSNGNQHQMDSVKENYARLLRSTVEYGEAVKVYQQIDNMNDVFCWAGLGLALAMSGSGDKSVKAYNKAIQLCDSDNVLKSSLLTAVAMVHYATGRKNDCKTCLFTAFQIPPPSMNCLTSLAVFSCLTEDWSVFTATLAEMLKIVEWQSDDSTVSIAHIISSLYYVNILVTKKNYPTAKKFSQEISEICSKLKHEDHKLHNPAESIMVSSSKEQSQKLLHFENMYHQYPGDVWTTLTLLTVVSSEQLQLRFVPLLKTSIANMLQDVQRHPKHVQDKIKQFVIAFHNWMGKYGR
ncbi:superkiller complex protein 3-like [Dysidea avara]|uniref:superkiller complex protein 3-like n=1 Tax=Dysidea avara TaxID=196820 RepID=UPI00332CC5AF